ncbi:hypothetical protein [uncultured Bartonella sp.]|uniref:hypothetical protein n=1 Tax=uncultured Bartonella sp. TaxID=104108 RepID=UPI002639F23D|nr:hypothetical protein [uncultured Bartonella sp.]
MLSGLYDCVEDFFNEKFHVFLEKIIIFSKNNYLFFCLLFALLWLTYLLYPGAVGYDSFAMYKDAYYNQIGNWHSALLSRFWQFILFFTEFRGIYLFIQLGCVFVGLYLIGKNISKGILTGIICVLILFIPPVFCYLFVVIKDTYLAAFVFLIAALMLDYALSGKKKSPAFYIFCTIVLVFCFYIRLNGCFVAIPLIVALLIGWKTPMIYRYILCLVVAGIVMATSSFVDIKLLKVRDDAPDFSLMLFDIIGTAKNSGQSTLPDIPEVPDQMAIINYCYTPSCWDAVSYWATEDHCKAIAKYYFDRKGQGREIFNKARKELQKAWITAIVEHPFAYFKHRLSHFNRFINYQGHRRAFIPLYITHLGFVDYYEKVGPLTEEKIPPKIWTKFMQMDLEHQLWFYPYVSLLILLFFYLSTLRTSDEFNRTLNVVSFSGLTYLFGYLFVGVSSNFRYSYPSFMLSILCILAAFAYYRQKREIFGTKKTRIIAASVTIPLFLVGIIL